MVLASRFVMEYFYSLENQNPGKTEPATKKAAAPITDNNFSMESTWKVAADRTESRNPQKPSNTKPKKQPKTQKTNLKNRDLHHPKSRNKKIQQTKTKKP
jgi:hypothetical protein